MNNIPVESCNTPWPRRMAFLTPTVTAYRIPFHQVLSRRVAAYHIIQSSPHDPCLPHAPLPESLAITTLQSLRLAHHDISPEGRVEKTYVYLSRGLISTLSKLAPEVIISDQLGQRTLGAIYYCWRHPETRLFIYVDGSDITEKNRNDILRRVLRPWLLRRADGVLVNGAGGTRYVRAQGVRPAKIHGFPYTTDPRFLGVRKTSGRTGELRLAYAGRFVPVKGLLEFLNILTAWGAQHPRQHIVFRLAGDGPLRGQLQARPLPPNVVVQIEDNLSYQNMPAFYAQADWLVFPSFSDTWGMAVQEAMAVGLPVLGSPNSQAVEELVHPGQTGWLFHPDRPAEIVAALDAAAETSTENYARMSDQARQAAVAHLPEQVVTQLMEFIIQQR